MRILSFDTSTLYLSLALYADGKVVSERIIPPSDSFRQEAVSQLMPNIDDIVKSNGWDRKSIDLIVVGVGPGSFTGLRTSVVTARTLAQALDLPLVGMDALKCFSARAELPAAVVLSGGRGHYFVAVYQSLTECSLEPRCVEKSELETILNDVDRCFIEDKLEPDLSSFSQKCRLLPPSLNLAAIAAELAWNELSLNATDREALKKKYVFDKVNPLYLRGASITLKKTDGAEQASSSNRN